MFLVVGCDSSSNLLNVETEIELDDKVIEDTRLNEIQIQADNNKEWTILVEDDVVVTNQLKCNDTTGKEVPLHLVEICNYYAKVEPLSNEQKEILYQGTGGLAAREAFNRELPIGQEGFAEDLKNYGEYLLFSYLFWRTGFKPNANGEFKRLNQTSDFDEFFQLNGDTVKTHYEPTGPNEGIQFETLLEAIEFEIKVASKMKNLNLEEPFHNWADETVEVLLVAKQFYTENKDKDAYINYYKGLKRVYDLYFTIPEHNHLNN